MKPNEMLTRSSMFVWVRSFVIVTVRMRRNSLPKYSELLSTCDVVNIVIVVAYLLQNMFWSLFSQTFGPIVFLITSAILWIIVTVSHLISMQFYNKSLEIFQTAGSLQGKKHGLSQADVAKNVKLIIFEHYNWKLFVIIWNTWQHYASWNCYMYKRELVIVIYYARVMKCDWHLIFKIVNIVAAGKTGIRQFSHEHRQHVFCTNFDIEKKS